MISESIVKIPYKHPEVYMNLMRIIATSEFGSVRPIAFRNSEGNSTVTSIDSTAYTTPDKFINALTAANYVGDAFDGIATANLMNKSEYALKDLAFDGNVSVDGDGQLLVATSKCDLTVFFRYGNGYFTSQENAEYLASRVSVLEMRGIVPFASNHSVVNNFTFDAVDGGFRVTLDAKDDTSVKDVLARLQNNVNSISIE